MKYQYIVSFFFCANFLAMPTQIAAQSAGVPNLNLVMDTLDENQDGELSAIEIDNAADRLDTLDTNRDGALSLQEIGGPGRIKGMIRRQSLIRVIDEDGDLSFSRKEIANVSDSIKRLDRDGDWHISKADLRWPAGVGMNEAVMGFTPEDIQELMYYPNSPTGALPPGKDERAYDGYAFYYEASNNNDVQVAKKAFLVDSAGKVVHTWDNPRHGPEGVNAYILENGLLLRTSSRYDWIRHKNYPVGSHGIIELVDWDGNILWEYEVDVLKKHVLHHDHAALPNGNVIVNAYVGFSQEEMIAMGWDPANSKKDMIWLEKLIELKPNLENGSTEIVWEWNSWDHFVQDRIPEKPNYGNVQENPDRIDLNYSDLEKVPFNSGQLIHMNSVAYNADLDQLMMSSAVYGEIWIIDHSTSTQEARTGKGGKYRQGGRLLYRWGNPVATKDGSLDDTILYFQHDAHWIPEGFEGAGDIMVFNNGSRRTLAGKWNHNQKGVGFREAYTDIVQFRPPMKRNGQYKRDKAAEITWSWNTDTAEDFYSPFMSGARRLPNGNTIFVSAYSKRIIEVTPDGERVLDYRTGGPGRLFRVEKYPKDYPGFTGKKL